MQNGRKYLQMKQPTRIDLQNIQTTHVVLCQIKKQPNQEMGRRSKQAFLYIFIIYI